MALSEADIDHMIAFIHQEARERVQEIEAKTEEEFNIEKGRLVQQERVRIMNINEKKIKQINTMRKIHESRVHNQVRLNKLKAQNDIITEVLESARLNLQNKIANKEFYKKALVQLGESEMLLSCIENDKSLVQEVLPGAQREAEKIMRISLSIKILEDAYLPTHRIGGIKLLTKNGAIKVDNTLATKLDILSRQVAIK